MEIGKTIEKPKVNDRETGGFQKIVIVRHLLEDDTIIRKSFRVNIKKSFALG